MEEFIYKRITEVNLFTEEEKEKLLSNLDLTKKIYVLGLLDILR